MANKKHSGFAVVELLLVLILMGIVGFTGYYVWHSRQDTDSVLNKSSQVASSKDTQPAKVTTKQLIQYSDQATVLVKKAYDAFGASMIKNNNTSKAVSDIHPYLTDGLYVSLNEESTASDPVFCTQDMSVPVKISVVSVIPSSTVIGTEVDTGRTDQKLIKVNVDHRLNKIISITCPSST